jgi:hypothetical protein
MISRKEQVEILMEFLRVLKSGGNPLEAQPDIVAQIVGEYIGGDKIRKYLYGGLNDPLLMTLRLSGRNGNTRKSTSSVARGLSGMLTMSYSLSPISRRRGSIRKSNGRNHFPCHESALCFLEKGDCVGVKSCPCCHRMTGNRCQKNFGRSGSEL